MKAQLVARNKKVLRKVKLEDYKGRKGLKAMNGDWLICPAKFCSLVDTLPAREDNIYTLHISLYKPRNKNSRCIFVLFGTALDKSLHASMIFIADSNMNVCTNNYMTSTQYSILLQFAEYSKYCSSDMRSLALHYWID